MDSLTHLVAGALTPIAFRDAPKRAGLVALGIVAGEFPDVDVVFGGTPEALMNLHRGITHSLFVQPISALLLAGVFYLLLRRNSGSMSCPAPLAQGFGFGKMFLAALLALYMHVFLDCMTTFGTQILLPFSQARVGFPAMFIVDLLCTLPALVLLAAALKQKAVSGVFPRKSLWLARAGLFWLIAYPLCSLAINAAVTSNVQTTLLADPGNQLVENVYEHGDPQEDGNLFLITEPFSPFVWKAVVDEGDNWNMGTVFLDRLNQRPDMARYPKPPLELLEALASQDSIFADYIRFCPLTTFTERVVSREEDLDNDISLQMALEITPELTVREITLMDMRYIPSSRSPLHYLGRTGIYFVMQARLDDAGRLVSWRFMQSSENLTEPWQAPRAVSGS